MTMTERKVIKAKVGLLDIAVPTIVMNMSSNAPSRISTTPGPR